MNQRFSFATFQICAVFNHESKTFIRSDFDRDRFDIEREGPEHPLRPQRDPDNRTQPCARWARLFPRRCDISRARVAALVLVAIWVFCVAFACETAPVRGEGRQGQAQDSPAYALCGRLCLAEVGLVATISAAVSALVFRRCNRERS